MGPDPLFFWALVFDVAVLAAVVFSLLLLRRSRSRPLRLLASAAIGLVCLFALYQCERSFDGALYQVISSRSLLVVRLVLLAALVLFILRWPRRVVPACRTVLLILSPLFIIFVTQGLVLYHGSGAGRYAPKLAAMLPVKASQGRVIWIIFDEMDYRLAFKARPTRIQLPYFDALRRVSVFADHVTSPAHDTLAAIPSLLLSKVVPINEDFDLNSRPVRVRFSGCSRYVSLRSQPNVFQRARALGYNAAVSGWYHAYCRLFGSDLSGCATDVGTGMALVPQQLLRHKPFFYKAGYVADWQARSLPLVQRLHWIAPMPEQRRYARQMHMIDTEFVRKHGMAMLRNRNLTFLLLHLPIPHPPGIWDTRTQSLGMSGRLDYIDNLEFADKVLGQIRQVLRREGEWDRSTVLVSADHPYRPDYWLRGLNVAVLSKAALSEMARATHMKWQPYIPFFLKMPGQKTGIEYHREFNSVLSADLLLAALQSKIRTPAQAVQWLDAHAAASEQKVCQ